MTISGPSITPCLWFDTEAEDAANLYVSIFPNAKITGTSHYGEEGFEIHGRKAGTVMAVEFVLDGRPFVGLNGGPQFKFDEAVSFQVHCDTQAEIDRYWTKLGADGGKPGPCGWIKDRFGLSWQVVPRALKDMLTDRDAAKVQRVTKAFLAMSKFDIAALEKAYAG
ncbi:MAG: VOC family protein [Rhizobiales bacterium]|nr:VOC family protein [Hyphomicrobiales bacterium]